MELGLGSLNVSSAGMHLEHQTLPGPIIEQLPSIDSSLVRVGAPLSVTHGSYRPLNDRTISVSGTWRLNGTSVATGPSYTPSSQDRGGTLQYLETVTEEGGGHLMLTVLHSNVLSDAVWDVSVATDHIIINDSPGPLSAPNGTVSEQTITFS